MLDRSLSPPSSSLPSRRSFSRGASTRRLLTAAAQLRWLPPPPIGQHAELDLPCHARHPAARRSRRQLPSPAQAPAVDAADLRQPPSGTCPTTGAAPCPGGTGCGRGARSSAPPPSYAVRATATATARPCGARTAVEPLPPKGPSAAPAHVDRAQRGPDPAAGEPHPPAADRSRWADPGRLLPRQGSRRAGTGRLSPPGRRPGRL